MVNRWTLALAMLCPLVVCPLQPQNWKLTGLRPAFEPPLSSSSSSWAASDAAMLERELQLLDSYASQMQEEVEADELSEVLESVSVFELPANEEELAMLEATEEGLLAASRPASWSARRNAIWDEMFWQEFGSCDEHERLAHFARSHRLVSLALSGRNRTELVCRPSPSLPVIEDELRGRVATAVTFYAGLTDYGSRASSVEPPAWVKQLASSLPLDNVTAIFAKSSAELAEERRAILFPGLVQDERIDEYRAQDEAAESDSMTTSTGHYGELVEKPPDMTLDDDDDAVAAAIRELDDDNFYTETDAARSDPLLIARDDNDDEDSTSRQDPDRHGRRVFDLAAYFRNDPVAQLRFPDLDVPSKPRKVSIVAQAQGTTTPLFSELETHVLTCYHKLIPNPRAGIIFFDSTNTTDDTIIIDSTYLHATYNDSPDDLALWLKVDFWHPDLQPAEVAALERFFRLDEQFALRRFASPQLLHRLFDTQSPLDFLP